MFQQIQNVRSINFSLENCERTVETSTEDDTGEVPVFFCLDTVMDDAFLHWQCESAVFLHYWSEFMSLFPNLIILLNHDRVYKRLTLKTYGIPLERIQFGGPATLPKRNLCILPPPHILDARSVVDTDKFLELWARHIQYLRDSAGVKDGDVKTIDVLGLPRQSRENFQPNERIVPETELMCNWVSRFEKGRVLHTDTITDLLDQVRIVCSSRIIVLDYGSSFYFNASLAKDSLIIVANRPQVNTHLKGIAHESWIRNRGNRIFYFNKFSDAFSLVEAEITST